MANDLPTLKGLRAFEEAFLLGSYTAAARKLNVQQPAISYQIKRLEEDLGLPLFIKDRGRLIPTSAANELFETLSQSFDAIRRTSNKLRQVSADTAFTIATYPGIGTYWLSSKLSVLSGELTVPVKVITLVRDADILREHADCLILFGTGNWPGFDAHLLMPEAVCPVAAPDLAASIQQQDGAAPPVNLTIIEQDDPDKRWLGWSDWQDQTGDAGWPSTERMIVNDHGFALHLALTGAGATLAWLGVVEDLLSGGSLVPLSDRIATSEAGYWLVGRPGFFETSRGRTILNILKADKAGATRP